MQQGLIVCLDKKWGLFLRFFAETYLQSQVDVPLSEAQALSIYRKKHTHLDFVIYYPGEGDFILEDLFEWKNKENKGPHLIVICSPQFRPTAPLGIPGQMVHFIDRDQAVRELGDWFQERGLIPAPMPFAPVSIDCLGLFDGAREDLYLKMGGEKYLKLFCEGDDLTDQDIKKYQSKGVTYLFLTPSAIAAIMEQLKAQFSLFLKNKKFKIVVRTEGNNRQAKFEQKIIRLGERLLVTEEFKSLVESKVKRSVELIKKNPRLSKLLMKVNLKETSGSYLPTHIIHLSTVSCALAKLVDWSSDMTLEKLVYASLLHDIMLFTHPAIAEIHTLENFEKIKHQLLPEEAQIFLDHPAEAAKLVEGAFNLAPPETETIILQHHEKPDGSGFPKRMNAVRIAPLSALFILAHDLVVYFMDNPDASMEEYVLRSEKHFNQGSFKSVVKALKEALMANVPTTSE